MTQVRHATSSDLEWLIPELREFSRFYGTKRSFFGDERHVRLGVLNMIDNHVVLVAEGADGEPKGFVAGSLAGHPFNPEIRTLTEYFWWVIPRHRGGRAGLMLLNAFVAWGEKHADWITFATGPGPTGSGVVSPSVLERRGFTLRELAFVKEIA